MDTSYYVGGVPAWTKLIRHPELRRFIAARYGIVRATALAVVVEEIAKGDLAIEDQILRSWGVR